MSVFEISNISAIYRISEPNDTIFAIENRSVEKSKKIGKISPIYRPVTDISVDFSTLGDTRAWGIFFGNFSSIYRRYIENIGDISEISIKISKIYRGYIKMTRFEILT